jgi:hypothetical protein
MLVEKYWDIHYVERYLPFSEIATRYMMLMEGNGFGRPGPEGKG